MGSNTALIEAMRKDVQELVGAVSAQREAIKHVEELAVDSNHVLRGHNGDKGLLTQFQELAKQVNDVLGTNDAQGALITGLRKETSDLKVFTENNPSLIYLIKHKPKLFFTIVGTLLLLLFLSLSGYLDPRVYDNLERLVHIFGG
jgi:hypothetical protein